MHWVMRFREWLSRLISPATRIEVVPEDQCRHHVAADPESTMHRLAAAVVDPVRFAGVLAESGNCRACQMAIIAELACTLAGIAVVDQADDSAAEHYMCDHDVNPEIIALRLVLAREAGDGTVLASTLAEIDGCPHCADFVFLSLLNAHTAILDNTGVDWAPLVEARLESLLPPGRS